jgi:hypothetical protein
LIEDFDINKKNEYKMWRPSKKPIVDWWNSLTLEEKQALKLKYEKVCEINPSRRLPFPHLVNTVDTRISKLTQNQIQCISRFKDYNLEKE